MEKIKILFLINTLGGGGAEKALVNLINHLDKTKYDITVETMFDDGVNAKNLKSGIRYISKKAPCPHGISHILKFIPSKVLYRYFIGKEIYDLLIAYMHGIPVKVIAGNKKAKTIAWLHNGNPETSTMFMPWLSCNRAIKAYDKCTAIVGVSESVSWAFSQYTGIRKKVFTVYNTLDTDVIWRQAKTTITDTVFTHDLDVINLVSTGRLSKEKGYARLINVCKSLKEKKYQFRLFLIGTGLEEKALKNQVEQLNLQSEVVFLGYQENPYQYVSKCDLFICSSYTEGLSTATIEALFLGKAIISTQVSGAKEILGDNEYGIIVENSEKGIYNGLKKFFDNKDLLREYGLKAEQRSAFFSMVNTVNSAENLLDTVASRKE